METRPQLEFCLLSWGANSYGQLGQGHAEDRCEPRLSDAAAAELQSDAVRTVAGGGGHSVLVTEKGQVFVCGQNHRGQLALGSNVDISTFHLCLSLDQTVTHVACGWDFTLFLTDGGQVLACGSNAFGQLGVGPSVTHSADLLVVKVSTEQCLKDPVVSVAAGLRHSLAVTDLGCVYQWGTGLFNHAKRATSPHPVPSHFCSKVPCLVPGLDQKISHLVAAGSAHCVCLTGDGDLFLWGSNKHGQLTATKPFLSTPAPLKRSLLAGEKVINVWSGWTHVVAQTESGKVFSWGRGDYGQLGRPASTSQNPEQQSAGPLTGGDNQEVCLPAEIEVLRGASQIACGSEHNLAIVGGCLLSWGWNEHGMCGDGTQTDICQPQLISGLRPLVIGCGAGHSMAVCAATTGSR
ncbi:secretion-regulating guanine nucleotide exchange factor isoform X1 [Scophthalmus maximus]|uniref:secretion-regulating guanine nucleotide exchange factor isoform X1 n=1 Tax=Scophthalmus maximus TaxID=52904 RepID=UPI0015E13526|nr:secretion-regulating guanine nucleotide exchange factor isoform X1 [Scophthalmus maximus]